MSEAATDRGPEMTGSQLACLCTELERLAYTVSGMLSQCETLGSPLGEDRPVVEGLLPTVSDLQSVIVSALSTDAKRKLEDDAAAEPTPLVRTTGARFIEWQNGQARTSEVPTAAPEDLLAEPAPLLEGADDLLEPVAEDLLGPKSLGDRETVEEPETTVETPVEQLQAALAIDKEAPAEFPSVDRCADLLMADLTSESVANIHDQGEVTLQGTNESLPLPSVFQFLGQTSKCGTLRVKTNRETMRFDLVDGDLVFSSSDNPPRDQLLGEILVERGYVTRAKMDEVLAGVSANPNRLGSILQDEAGLSLDDLRAALKAQIKNRLERAFQEPESAFTFSEGGPSRPHHRIKMDVTQLLLESL